MADVRSETHILISRTKYTHVVNRPPLETISTKSRYVLAPDVHYLKRNLTVIGRQKTSANFLPGIEVDIFNTPNVICLVHEDALVHTKLRT